MRIPTATAFALLLALSACSEPPPPEEPLQPQAQAAGAAPAADPAAAAAAAAAPAGTDPTALRRAIEEPIDQAKAVQDTQDAAEAERQRALEETGG